MADARNDELTVATYVVELYLPRRIPSELTAVVTRAKAAEPMPAGEAPVRFLRSIFLPGDEICWLVYEGPSTDAVTGAVRKAGIAFERVAEASQLGREELLS